MSRIRELFDLNDSFLRENSKIEYGDMTFVAGAELEIESLIALPSADLAQSGIGVVTDGSLRNNGREFLLPPSTIGKLKGLFKITHRTIQTGPDAFSNRTSIHVHVNCMYSTEQQVKALLYLYAIFEPLAFAYAGPQRRDNIHCMPLVSTHMPNLYASDLPYIAERWHKYTAFNLLPLRELGTVEFRHLYGTNDAVVFNCWLDFISILWESAMKLGSFRVELLKDLTILRSIQNALMTKEFISLCKERPEFILEDNLLDVKLAFI